MLSTPKYAIEKFEAKSAQYDALMAEGGESYGKAESMALYYAVSLANEDSEDARRVYAFWANAELDARYARRRWEDDNPRAVWLKRVNGIANSTLTGNKMKLRRIHLMQRKASVKGLNVLISRRGVDLPRPVDTFYDSLMERGRETGDAMYYWRARRLAYNMSNGRTLSEWGQRESVASMYYNHIMSKLP